jgi:hypothetical protein
MTELTSARDQQIQELLDKQAIRETLVRYFRGVDRCDASLISSAFHPDAIDEHSSLGTYTGENVAAEVVDFVRTRERNPMHMVTSTTIHLDGDVAGSETCFIGAFWMVGEDLLRLTFGRLLDRFERRNGEWKIAHRQLVPEITHYLKPADYPEPGSSHGLGRLDRTDPSYAVLGD